MSWTGSYMWSEEDAIRISKRFSKIYKQYHSYVKGEPEKPDYPEQCFAITDRFDPSVRRSDANAG